MRSRSPVNGLLAFAVDAEDCDLVLEEDCLLDVVAWLEVVGWLDEEA